MVRQSAAYSLPNDLAIVARRFPRSRAEAGGKLACPKSLAAPSNEKARWTLCRGTRTRAIPVGYPTKAPEGPDLAVFPVEVPSLRARREDIPLLVWHFVSKKQARLGKRIDEIPQTTMDRLTDYAWPGNIREMENVVERAMILSPDSTLVLDQPLDVVDMPASLPHAEPSSMESVVRRHMISVLRECHWRIKGAGGAADRLGMDPGTLRHRMKKLAIRRPD